MTLKTEHNEPKAVGKCKHTCHTSGTRCATLVTNPVIGKSYIMTKTL